MGGGSERVPRGRRGTRWPCRLTLTPLSISAPGTRVAPCAGISPYGHRVSSCELLTWRSVSGLGVAGKPGALGAECPAGLESLGGEEPSSASRTIRLLLGTTGVMPAATSEVAVNGKRLLPRGGLHVRAARAVSAPQRAAAVVHTRWIRVRTSLKLSSGEGVGLCLLRIPPPTPPKEGAPSPLASSWGAVTKCEPVGAVCSPRHSAPRAGSCGCESCFCLLFKANNQFAPRELTDWWARNTSVCLKPLERKTTLFSSEKG